MAGVLQLLCAQPDRLEPDLIILDQGLTLDEGVSLDVLARDAGGTPVVILLCGPDLAQAIGRCAGALGAWHQGRFLLDRLYGHAGLVADQRPRFMLISRRFSAGRPADLLQLVGGCDVAVFESQVVQSVDGRPELHLLPMARSGFGEAAAAQGLAAPAPARPAAAVQRAAPAPALPAVEPLGSGLAGPHAVADESANPLIGGASATILGVGGLADEQEVANGDRPGHGAEPVQGAGVTRASPAAPATNPGFPMAVTPTPASEGEGLQQPAIDDVDLLVRTQASPECRRLCLAARDSIRSLSSLVSQTIESDRICFLVDKVPLATLIPRGESLQLRVGEEGGPVFEVHDDESFNASLNATFSHYFSRFAVRA